MVECLALIVIEANGRKMWMGLISDSLQSKLCNMINIELWRVRP
jgi:hypothetical protein